MNCRKYRWDSECFLEGMCESMVTWKSECYREFCVGEWTDGK